MKLVYILFKLVHGVQKQKQTKLLLDGQEELQLHMLISQVMKQQAMYGFGFELVISQQCKMPKTLAMKWVLTSG